MDILGLKQARNISGLSEARVIDPDSRRKGLLEELCRKCRLFSLLKIGSSADDVYSTSHILREIQSRA